VLRMASEVAGNCHARPTCLPPAETQRVAIPRPDHDPVDGYPSANTPSTLVGPERGATMGEIRRPFGTSGAAIS
jgi:hypothetical protein